MAKRKHSKPPQGDSRTPPPPRRWNRRQWLWLLAVLAAAVVPFLPSSGGELVWDDRILIEEELRFHSPGFALEVFAQDFFDDIEEIYRYGYYRPLTTLSYYFTWLVVKAEPQVYHLTNIAVHAMVSLLILLFGRQLAPQRPVLGIVAALVFAVHPVHVENVAWISGRTDLLAGLLLMAAAVLLLEALTEPTCKRIVPFAFSMLLFAASPLAKEAVVFWPLLLAVLALLVPADRRRWWWLATIASTMALIPAVLLRLLVADTTGPSQQWSTSELPTVALTFFATVARYFRALLLPTGSEPYIQNPLIQNPLDVQVLVGLCIVAGLIGLGWRTKATSIELTLPAFFLLLSLAPISNLVRIAGPADMGAPMAQRFLYIPSIGFCLLVGAAASLIHERSQTKTQRRIWVGATVAVLAALAVGTVASAKAWTSEAALFELMVDQVPDAPLPLLLIGTVHCRAGLWEPCISRLRAADRLLPQQPTKMTIAVKSNLAGALNAAGQAGEARALLQELRGTTTPTSNVEYNLGMTWLGQGRTSEALTCFDRALAINPWNPRALVARSRIRAGQRDLSGAVADLDAATGRYGDNGQSLVARALVLGLKGDEQAAASALRRAAVLGDLEGLQMLGGWAASTERWDESLKAYRQLAAKQPKSWQAVHGAATALVRLERRNDALELLATYSKRNGPHPRINELAGALGAPSGPDSGR